MFAGILKEDGQKHFTSTFPTPGEAKRAAAMMWFGSKFDVVELSDDAGGGAVYEVLRYIDCCEIATPASVWAPNDLAPPPAPAPQEPIHKPASHRGPRKKSWQQAIIDEVGNFTLEDLYARSDKLKAATGSSAAKIEPVIRQTMQALRERGLIEFVDNNGTYRWVLGNKEKENK